MLYIIMGIVLIGIIVALAFAGIQRRKHYSELAQKENDIREKVSSFENALRGLGQSYIPHTEECVFSLQWRDTYDYLKGFSVPKKHPLFSIVSSAIHRYENMHYEVERLNSAFVVFEKNRCNSLLSDIDGKSLDDQQRTVVVTDEDHNLVLAGAGSGKTLTIAGKVKYLVEEKGIDPKEILLIAFTKKSAEEMTERIAGRLSIPVEATTFHKLGLDIIKSATDSRPEVFDNLSDFVTGYFESSLIKNQELIRCLIEYFAYYLNIPADMEQYDSLGAAYEHEKGLDFETVRSKYERAQFASNEAEKRKVSKTTLQGETVRSLEEVTIANFLFLNGVKYDYERLYPFESDDPQFKAYRPDFYLPDYDLYIEHFGINRDGRLPWLSPVEEEKYIEGMHWKRSFHQKNGTKLLETYSYYSSEGVLLDKLEELLKVNGVKFRQPDYSEIFDAIYSKESDKYFAEFKKLCGTFITLFKSNGYKESDIAELRAKGTHDTTPFFAQRTVLFLNIVAPIIEAYETYLKENHAIDFSDMIIQATDIVRAGHTAVSYRYVIIDEYQDISVARYKLVKEILNKTKAHLLCVGDDWQSIYRFAGSDISLFTRFEAAFGYTATMRLEQTYRNSQQLINDVGRFITKNPEQLKKSLRSGKNISYPISFWFYQESPFAVLRKMLDKLIADFGQEASIMLLGRTSFDGELLAESGLFDMKISHNGMTYKYKDSPKTPITFLTVHKAKGLEADNVILLNFENSTLGFPNKISDDPILGLVLSLADTYPYAEERRLLYVALTRTKNRAFVLTNERSPSEFLNDFKPSQTIFYVGQGQQLADPVLCPRCKTGHLVVRKNEGTNTYFVGCSNYPHCEYTVRDTSVLTTKKKCPRCGGFLVQRKGRYGQFWGCTNYPACSYTEQEVHSETKRRIGF